MHWVDAAIIDSLKIDERSEVPALPYLNQDPPGMTPQAYNPPAAWDWGIVVGPPSFDSSGTKCLFLSDFKLYETEVCNGVWSTPMMVDLGAEFEDHGVFGHGLSPDWRRLYFNSLRSAPDSCSGGRAPIWLSRQQQDTWSRPDCIGLSGMAVSVAASGTIYFTTWVDGRAQLARCRSVDGSLGEPEVLPAPLLSEYEAMHPCIASDESYILFDSEDRLATGPCHLFVSFRNEDTGWSEPISLGNCISQENAAMARLSADDRFLFYNDRTGQTYWPICMQTERD